MLLGLLVGTAFLYNSEMLEQEPPRISAPEKTHWNLKEPLTVVFEDNTGIRHYKALLSINGTEQILDSNTYETPEQRVEVAIKPPKMGIFGNNEQIAIRLIATDGSSWNFLRGNQNEKQLSLTIDTQAPKLLTLANSYSITKGGSALVVFKATDKHLKNVTVSNGVRTFTPQPFYKPGYYVSLIPWSVKEPKFKATLHAEDMAGNRFSQFVRFFQKSKKYKKSSIRLSDSFLEGKLATLADSYANGQTFEMPLERFTFVNEKLREQNEKILHEASSYIDTESLLEYFHIEPFYPLRNAAAISSFGSHRSYLYKGDKVSESFHLGLDLASVKNAPILSSNDAVVTYAENSGIYGNTVVLSHGMGLFSLYSHCSSMLVNKGDIVTSGTEIAKTGITGLSFGDHLHFSILVQGVEVRPEEWMDKKWMELNVFNILSTAKKMIDSEI